LTIGEDVADAMLRTVGFARRLHRESGGRLRHAGLVAAAAGDELLLAIFRQLRAPASDTTFASWLDEAVALVERLDREGVLADPTRYHEAPAAPALNVVARRVGRISFGHATYPSPYSPDASLPGAVRFFSDTDNRTVHAWMLRQVSPAPWVVCVHGAGMGDPLADIVAFRAARLHSAGFNVAIPVLPHHGPRGAGRFEVAFPTDDPTMNLHAAAQAIADVRAMLAHIAARGERAVVYGISLGGYVAASVAALEPDLAGVIVGVPVVDIAHLMRTHAPPRFLGNARFAEFCSVAGVLDGVTSALALPTPVPAARGIWAGRADRLVRPSQVARLAAHWGNPDVCWYAGGHLGFLAAGSVRRHVAASLVQAGIAEANDGWLRAVA
jgi:pimeloyl-ACP methyl ester carboxylesterase